MQRKTSPDEIRPFLTDASNFQGGRAEGVAFPENENEVIEFLKEAHRGGVPVTVAGSGTGLTGARAPLGGWVLATDRLARVKDIHPDPAGRVSWLVAGPGICLKDLQDQASSAGLLYPPDPTSFKSFLGGNVATNASGPRTFKYGPTRDFIRRLRVVLATGDVLNLKRGEIFSSADGILDIPLPSGSRLKVSVPTYAMPRVKNTAGYFVSPRMDVVDLFIGSEGTLGVVTEIEVGLLPVPPAYFGFVGFFPSAENSWKFAAEARTKTRVNQGARNDAGIQARAIEYMDGPSLDLIREKFSEIPAETGAAIFVEQECQNETREMLVEAWCALLERCGARLEDFWLGENAAEQDRQHAFRHQVPLEVRDFLARSGQSKVGTDIAVPESAFEEFMIYQRGRLEALGLPNVTFGHIGDCHVHLNILPKNEGEHERALRLHAELIEKAIAKGGTVAAEHGIGKLKKPFLLRMVGEKGIREMAGVKKTLDPKGILGRGSVFDEKFLS